MSADAILDLGAQTPLVREAAVDCAEFDAIPAYYRWEHEWASDFTCHRGRSTARGHQIYISIQTARHLIEVLEDDRARYYQDQWRPPVVQFSQEILADGADQTGHIAYAGFADRVNGIVYLSEEFNSREQLSMYTLLHELAHVYHYRAFANVRGYDHNAQGHGPDFRWMQMGLYRKILVHLTFEDGCRIAARMQLPMTREACG